MRRAGSERATRVYKTQKEAEQFGRELAKKEKTEFVLHGRNGRSREKDSYGNDPYPPRDREHWDPAPRLGRVVLVTRSSS